MIIGDKVKHNTNEVGVVIELAPKFWNGKKMVYPDSGVIVKLPDHRHVWWHKANIVAYDS